MQPQNAPSWVPQQGVQPQNAPSWAPQGMQPQNAPSWGPSGGAPRSQVSSVFRLRPFTSYKLRLKATNDIGDSDFSAETEAVTTLQDGEQQGPRPAAACAPRNPGS